MGLRAWIIGAIVATSVIPSVTSAAVWTQTGVPGSLPATAQVTAGIGTLDAIHGQITGVDQILMFQIFIPNVSLFSATTVGPGTEFLDTQLFLFDSTGIGVLANDDTDPLETNATLPAGTATAAAGLYYLAISEFADKPLSAGGLIFPDYSTVPSAPSDAVVGPTGPGGASPVSSWFTDGFSETEFPPFPVNYVITLSGAEFASPPLPVSVPEPQAICLWLAAVGLTAICRSFRGISLTNSRR